MNLSLTTLIIILFSNYCYAQDTISNHDNNVKLGLFPYVGMFETKIKKHRISRCTCSLIDANTVLTAAHCIVTKKGTMRVRFGLVNPKSGSFHEQRRKVTAVYIYPGYQSNSSKCLEYFHKAMILSTVCLIFCVNDVAVIKVKKPFVFNQYVQPIELVKPTDYIGQNVLVMGYGKSGIDKSDDLLYGFNRVLIDKGFYFCTEVFVDSSSMFVGDSGGPVVIESGGRPIQIGVNSMGVIDGNYLMKNDSEINSCQSIEELFASTIRSNKKLYFKKWEDDHGQKPLGCFFKVGSAMEWIQQFMSKNN